MFFGPIVSLEMVTSARRARYFLLRVFYAALLLALLWVNYAEASALARMDLSTGMSINAVAQLSYKFFVTFAFAQLGAVLVLTPAMMAGAIAQERERRTIEYLFASTLTGSEIIFSKFVARTLHVVAQLTVGLPILALGMMLGGIQPALLLAVFAVTFATLLATAALSIATSVWSKRSRDAVVRTYLLVLVFVALPPVALGISNGPLEWDWLRDVLRVLGAPAKVNPFGVLSVLFQSRIVGAGSTTSSWSALVQLLASAGVFTVVTLAWATVSIRRVYRKSMGVGSGAPRRSWLRRFRPSLGERPMLWKELFAATAALQLGTLGRIAALLLFVGATAPAYMMFLHEMARSRRPGVGINELLVGSITIVTLLECVALAVVAIRAAGSITAEKERDSWLTLVSTSLTPREIIGAKVAGSIYAARWFALPIGIWWLLTVILTPGYLIILPMLAFSFMCVAWAVATIGVWFSSWCTTSIRAMAGTMGLCVFAGTMGLCVFLGGGYLLCCIPVFQGSGEGLIYFMAPCIPFLLAMPTVFWLEGSNGSLSSWDINSAFAFLLGICGYIVLGIVMMHTNITDFDRRVGRPMRAEPFRPPPPLAPPPPDASESSGDSGALL